MSSNTLTDNSLKLSEEANQSLEEAESFEEQISYCSDSEAVFEKEKPKYISVGDSVPYGIRLFYGSPKNLVRMKDIAVRKRVLILGVIGSFTPYCWNRHLFRVLSKSRYFEERGIDYICCISTNDAYTQQTWGQYLGCSDSVLMLADTTCKFTKAIGMNIVLPWLDNKIRSRRYILYTEDAVVSKMIVAPDDELVSQWNCRHIRPAKGSEDDSESSA